MSPSFNDCRNAEPLRLEFLVADARIIECVCPERFQYGISTAIHLSATVDSSEARDATHQLPFEEASIEIRIADEASILSLEGKYPLGWIEVSDDYMSVVIRSRPSLAAQVASHIPLLGRAHLYFSLTLPSLESYALGLYPLLGYAYSVKTKSGVV